MTVYEHPDYKALLAGVIEFPDQDIRRLVLANWLEEQSEAKRAKFIRSDCERWSRWPDFRLVPQSDRPKMYHDAADLSLIETRLMELGAGNNGVCDNCDWHINIPHAGWYWSYSRGFITEAGCSLTAWCGGECLQCSGRGRFIDYPENEQPACHICHGVGYIAGNGSSVVKNHPINKVDLAGREPSGRWEHRGFAWVPGFQQPNAYELPFELCKAGKWKTEFIGGLMVHMFPTREAAIAALSEAAIRWAKDQPL